MMDAMVDLETFSSQANAVIATIAAVVFDPDMVNSYTGLSSEDSQFVRKLDIASQPLRHFDGDTIRWWLTQDVVAQKVVCDGRATLANSLAEFRTWLIHKQVDRLWAHGAAFDHAILEHAFRQVGVIHPIPYSSQFCSRTIVRTVEIPRPELVTSHIAIDDAIIQTIWLQKALRKIQGYEDSEQKGVLRTVGEGTPR